GRSFQSERQHLRICGRSVRPPEGLNSGLKKFACSPAFQRLAKHRTEITKAVRLAGRGGRKVFARHRDCEVRAQTQLLPLSVTGEIHAPADFLAGKVEKRPRGLQDRRFNARVTGTLEGCEERLAVRIRSGAACVENCARHGAFGVRARWLWRPVSRATR